MPSDRRRSPLPGPREGEDRRHHPRTPVEWPVTIDLDDGPHEARVRDVSRAGICFFLDRPVAEMTTLRLALDVPAESQRKARVAGSGVVVRCRRVSRHLEHYEIALFLHDMGAEDRDRLEAYVAGRAV